jgi:hypothetical protein
MSLATHASAVDLPEQVSEHFPIHGGERGPPGLPRRPSGVLRSVRPHRHQGGSSRSSEAGLSRWQVEQVQLRIGIRRRGHLNLHPAVLQSVETDPAILPAA